MKVTFNISLPSPFDAFSNALCAKTAPPPPHDPRERDLVLTLGGWQVRLFGDAKFRYFASRGLWHMQLWHPETEISVLTPSRLTCGFYEAFPVADWKGQAGSLEELASLLGDVVRLPPHGDVLRLERALVDDVVTCVRERAS